MLQLTLHISMGDGTFGAECTDLRCCLDKIKFKLRETSDAPSNCLFIKYTNPSCAKFDRLYEWNFSVLYRIDHLN